MNGYFQKEHFDFLVKLHNQQREKDNQAQNVEYEKLKEAYDLTKQWGELIIKKLYPQGDFDFRNSPTDQRNKFKSYTWAKLYPLKSSPRELAVTVGIEGNWGFVTKIDTVNANKKLRSQYEHLRGKFNDSSPIISILPIKDGLSKSIEELAEWSEKSIKNFGFSYDDLCTKLGLVDKSNSVAFTAQLALNFLKARYSNSEQKTQKIFLSVNGGGKEIALETRDLSTVTVRVFIKDQPPENIIQKRQCIFVPQNTTGASPNHNLNNNTKTLRAQDDFYQVNPQNLEELHSLCDWLDKAINYSVFANLDNKSLGLKKMEKSLNCILFGAAGTGKTYNTINHALSIIDNVELKELESKTREELKNRFNELKANGQIKFVTFHQSFSYEDFVEGIRAETDEQGNLTYSIVSGVFKQICDQVTGLSQQVESIDSVVENFLEEITEKPLELSTQQNKKFVVSYVGSGLTLQCQPLASETKATHYANISKIKGLLSGETLDKVYNRSYIKAVAEYLKPQLTTSRKANKNQNYVMIIDEINRGNISRIFGELITLIEDSKRAGAAEELSVTLPYSKKEFTVPKNLYILGTMNSSDRSLTGLDIALRRRFTFIEMPPQPELLKNIRVEGLNIGELLRVINQRIEVLLDRDHCIGHANFMTLTTESKVDELAQIFKQKIIPQLQEYFFDDWAKINMVLNANGMLKSKAIERSTLFPNADTDSEGFFEEQKIWQLVETAFDSVDSFNKIIKH